jgi:L-alanine-DL-glutamate epimerase-like enolase superfamily enzyme
MRCFLKITKADVFVLNDPEKPQNHPIWIRIYTDQGVYGDGEAGLAYGVAGWAAFGIVKDYAAVIIGEDPLDHETIWNKLYKTTFWGQNGGPVTFAGISAIDIALWDIKGKVFNQPVYRLLGGKFREKLRAYASQLQHGWSETRGFLGKTEDYAVAAKEAVERDGFDAVKVDFIAIDTEGNRNPQNSELYKLLTPETADRYVERLRVTREAVGPSVDIIAENHAITNSQGAVQLAERIKQYNIFYYEEPATPNPKLFSYIQRRTGLPLASGERIYSRWQYFPYFENSSLQVIQPDLANTGGITEGKKIADAAYVYDTDVQFHVAGSPIAIAATLQLEAAIPNFLIHEHHFPNQYNRKLAIHDYQPVNGYFAVPELPGIGNEISEFAIAHSVKATVE